MRVAGSRLAVRSVAVLLAVVMVIGRDTAEPEGLFPDNLLEEAYCTW